MGFGKTMRVSEKDFEAYTLDINVTIYYDDDFTVAELARLLPATEFAEWCGDKKKVDENGRESDTGRL